MGNKQKSKKILINGRPATKWELQRIDRHPATPSDPNDLATKPIGTMSRPFSILR